MFAAIEGASAPRLVSVGMLLLQVAVLPGKPESLEVGPSSKSDEEQLLLSGSRCVFSVLYPNVLIEPSGFFLEHAIAPHTLSAS